MVRIVRDRALERLLRLLLIGVVGKPGEVTPREIRLFHRGIDGWSRRQPRLFRRCQPEPHFLCDGLRDLELQSEQAASLPCIALRPQV